MNFVIGLGSDKCHRERERERGEREREERERKRTKRYIFGIIIFIICPCLQHTVTIYSLPNANECSRKGESVRVIPLPLGANSQLIWINFTDKGNLVAMDSNCEWQ